MKTKVKETHCPKTYKSFTFAINFLAKENDKTTKTSTAAATTATRNKQLNWIQNKCNAQVEWMRSDSLESKRMWHVNQIVTLYDLKIKEKKHTHKVFYVRTYTIYILSAAFVSNRCFRWLHSYGTATHLFASDKQISYFTISLA